MITLVPNSTISPVCDVKNSNSFLSVSGKLATLGLFFVKNKDQKNSKAFKNYQVIRAESPPLTLKVPIPQNGQKHSNNSNCLSVFDHFVKLALKGLR